MKLPLTGLVLVLAIGAIAAALVVHEWPREATNNYKLQIYSAGIASYNQHQLGSGPNSLWIQQYEVVGWMPKVDPHPPAYTEFFIASHKFLVRTPHCLIGTSGLVMFVAVVSISSIATALLFLKIRGGTRAHRAN